MVPRVVGSSPISHPIREKGRSSGSGPFFYLLTQGCSQAVRQGTLTPSFAGSSPAIPATFPLWTIISSDPVAQLVEQRPFKAKVRGSSPRWVTNKTAVFIKKAAVFVIFSGDSILGPLEEFNFNSTRSKIQAFFKNTSARISAFFWSACSMTWA